MPAPRRVAPLGAVAVIGLGLAACASPTPPSFIQAQRNVEQAQQDNPANYAPAELREARAKIDAAAAAEDDGDMETAERLAREAQVNVDLAAAKAQTEQARRLAQSYQASVDDLESAPGTADGASGPSMNGATPNATER